MKEVGWGQLFTRDLYVIAHVHNFVYTYAFMCIRCMVSCVAGVDVICIMCVIVQCAYIHTVRIRICGWLVRKVRDSAEQKHPLGRFGLPGQTGATLKKYCLPHSLVLLDALSL